MDKNTEGRMGKYSYSGVEDWDSGIHKIRE